jgi:type IV secretory pathway VirB4 component
MSTRTDRARSGFRPVGSLRLPAHRESSATLAGAYPFLAAPPPNAGVPIGTDTLTGSVFAFDPWTLYAAGVLTNPNVLLAGVIGQGKSALAKSLAIRSIAAGRAVYVPGDPKGEWAAVAHAVGGRVLTLGPGQRDRLNPLDTPAGADPAVARAGQLALLGTLAETAVDRALAPVEHTLISTALTATAAAGGVPTMRGLVDRLANPDPRVARELRWTAGEYEQASRDLTHGLRRLVVGDLGGMFDGPTTVALDPQAPMVVLDLSRLGSHDQGLTLAMACGSAWLDTAVRAGDQKRWIIYDEAWRILSSLPLLRRMQSQWKLSRAHGIANLIVLHRLSDLDATGAAGSQTRAVAEGLFADCSTRVIYRQESDQVGPTTTSLGLTAPERAIITALPRGTGLWKLPRTSHVVAHQLHPAEVDVVDTDRAMRDTPPPPVAGDGGPA